MPAYNYPGVYIEEIPSGVRTIVGVATSITAFLGRAARGLANEPTTLNSFADFERRFGGLKIDYPMSYAVRDFFSNGGSQAIIVRLFKVSANDDGIAKVTIGGLKLVAADPGLWGASLKVTIDTNNITDDVAKRYNLPKADLFNVTVEEDINGKTVRAESLRNVSVQHAAGSRRVDRVLESESSMLRAAKKPDGSPDLGNGPPGAGSTKAQG